MFSDRSSHQIGSRCNHHRGGGEYGCGDGRRDGGLIGGRSPPFNSRHGQCGRESEGIGYGREGRVRLDDVPILQRRRGSMGSLGGMGGLGGLGSIGGGLGGMGGGLIDGLGARVLGGEPIGHIMPPLGGLSRGSPMMGHRVPLGHDPLLRDERILGMGSLMSPQCSRDSLLGRRRGMMPLDLGMGHGARPGSIRSVGSVTGMELARLGMGRRLSNYRPPYVEDYESEYDYDEREIQLMDYLAREGMMHPEIFGDYMYGGDFGGVRGRPF